MKTFLAVAVFACSSTAFAQGGLGFWFNAGQSIVSNPGLGTVAPCTSTALCEALGASSKDLQLTNGFRFSLRGDFDTGDHIGYEIGYAYNRTQLQDNTVVPRSQSGMAYHQVMFNGMWHFTPEASRIRPFVTGGVGFVNFVQPGASAGSGGGSTKFGFNYGAGIKARVRGPIGFRVDLRQTATPKPFGLPLASGWFRSTEVSAGVGFLF
jgi:opacity protein-like surface antigen